jgi:hypothetical protein
MERGPIEILDKYCPIESPIFLYDPLADEGKGKRYNSYKECEKLASDKTITYLAVQ